MIARETRYVALDLAAVGFHFAVAAVVGSLLVYAGGWPL